MVTPITLGPQEKMCAVPLIIHTYQYINFKQPDTVKLFPVFCNATELCVYKMADAGHEKRT